MRQVSFTGRRTTHRQSRLRDTKDLTGAFDRALSVDPLQRPRAGELARALRFSAKRGAERCRKQKHSFADSFQRPNLARLGHALASALVVAWATYRFPFYPAHAQIPLAILAATVSFSRPRMGNALTLVLLLLPLGNYSLGLALVFALVATCWLAFTWRSPHLAQLPILGPLAVACGGLFLLPLAVLRIGGAARRMIFTFAAFVLALIVAGTDGQPLPLTNANPPRGLGIEGSTNATAIATALLRALAERPALLAEGCLLALVAALIPLARRRGRWGSAGPGREQSDRDRRSLITRCRPLLPARARAGVGRASVWPPAIRGSSSIRRRAACRQASRHRATS